MSTAWLSKSTTTTRMYNWPGDTLYEQGGIGGIGGGGGGGGGSGGGCGNRRGSRRVCCLPVDVGD